MVHQVFAERALAVEIALVAVIFLEDGHDLIVHAGVDKRFELGGSLKGEAVLVSLEDGVCHTVFCRIPQFAAQKSDRIA